jgi:hypothetical protein
LASPTARLIAGATAKILMRQCHIFLLGNLIDLSLLTGAV